MEVDFLLAHINSPNLIYMILHFAVIWFYSVDYTRALPILKFVIELYNYDVIVFGNKVIIVN